MSQASRRVGWLIGRALFAALFVLGGVGHFANPAMYLRIMPPYLPSPLALVYLSGGAELLLGSLLPWRRTQVMAAWGLIALLIAVFPANVFMWQHADRFPIPPMALLLRLPLQAVMIAWACVYTRDPEAKTRPSRPDLLVAGLLLISTVGCGLGRPSLPKLDRGALVRAESLDGKPVIVFFAASQETVATGTILRVVSDDEGTPNQVNRKVIVGFQDGPHQGLAGMIQRSDLQTNH